MRELKAPAFFSFISMGNEPGGHVGMYIWRCCVPSPGHRRAEALRNAPGGTGGEKK